MTSYRLTLYQSKPYQSLITWFWIGSKITWRHKMERTLGLSRSSIEAAYVNVSHVKLIKSNEILKKVVLSNWLVICIILGSWITINIVFIHLSRKIESLQWWNFSYFAVTYVPVQAFLSKTMATANYLKTFRDFQRLNLTQKIAKIFFYFWHLSFVRPEIMENIIHFPF